MFVFLCLVISCRLISSQFIHVVKYHKISSLLKAKCYSMVCIYHIGCIQNSLYTHLVCFHILSLSSSSSMSICVLLLLWHPALNSFIYYMYVQTYTELSKHCWSYNHLIVIFWGLLTPFSIAVAPFCFPTNNAQVFLHIPANTLSFVFLMIVIVAGISRYIFVVLIYISLIINEDHFFICLLAICVPSLEKSPFKFLDHFLNPINIFFCYWVARVRQRINLLLNLFSQSIGWLSTCFPCWAAF